MWLEVVLFAALLALLAYLDTRKPRRYPPGPAWLPVLGSALTVLRGRRRTGSLCQATADLAHQYGPVVGLKVGRELVVVVYGPKAVREFLASDDLAGRPIGAFYDMRTWGKRRGVLLTDSEFWQEQRRFVLRQLREFGFGRRNMSHMIEAETAELVAGVRREVRAGGGQATYQMEEFFNISILNTLWMMMAGQRYEHKDKKMHDLLSILTDLFSTVDMVGAPFSHFPILRFLAPQRSGYSTYVKAHLRVWDFLWAELRRHKESYDPAVERDFMDVYLKMLRSPERKDSYTEQQLLAICMDMFMAGSETTSKTLGFCFLYLLANPDIQRRAQEELDRVVGRDRLPSLEDRPNLPYIEGMVLESLRMFSGRAFTVPHRAMRDTYLHGYFIPKNAMLVANLQGCLQTPESGYPDRDAFRPERFIKEGHIQQPENYIPFGNGRHRCMGEGLARANVFLFTASLLQNFTLTVPPGDTLPTTRWVDGVTPGPRPFRAIFTCREPEVPLAQPVCKS